MTKTWNCSVIHRWLIRGTTPGTRRRPFLVPSAADRHCADLVLVDVGHLAQEARKPMFALKSADGAFGGRAQATQRVYDDFRELAIRILDASVAAIA
jgi:hypothetical protein